jgi:hypothetical protein
VQTFYAPPLAGASTADSLDRKLAEIEKEQRDG